MLTTVLDKMIDAQSKSEARLLEFEEKRMKLEEAQRSQARDDDREEQRERRSFQLAMMQMLQGQAATPFPALQSPAFPHYTSYEDNYPPAQ